MSVDKALSWSYAEDFIPVPPALTEATYRAEEVGVSCVSPAAGGALRLLAGACGAKAVLELGTGVGVGSLWLLSGMAADGVLTSIDIEDEYHRHARHLISEAGIPSNRVRLITGRALDILPRMAANAYDMMVVDANVEEIEHYLAHAQKLLRPGGILVILHALWHDQVPDPARRESDTVAMRSALNAIRGSEEFLSSLFTCGDGVLAAIKL